MKMKITSRFSKARWWKASLRAGYVSCVFTVERSRLVVRQPWMDSSACGAFGGGSGHLPYRVKNVAEYNPT